MFIVTAKLRRRWIVLGVVAFVLLCGVTIAPRILPIFGDTQVISSTVPSPKDIKTNEDRVAYLNAFGWQVLPDAIATEELLIPEEFTDVYQQYLQLQSDQGFDLTQYQGERVKRYTYEITNYPTGETGVQVGILIYKNTVIGGEVLSSDVNGFIHGLDFPA